MPNQVGSEGGGGLDRFEYRGFDQWFRLAVPVSEGSRLDNPPDRFGLAGYLRFVTLPKGTRPVIRNYTVRAFRPESLELDVDFVVHGTEGVAAPWAASVQPGAEVAFIDQGCGWAPVPSDWLLLAADESGLPAVRALEFAEGSVYAFAVGESALATGVRRQLVSGRGVPKGNVTFCGYWKRQKAN